MGATEGVETMKGDMGVLLDLLRQISKRGDTGPEEDHADADGFLLQYIGDPEITEAYDAIHKWYA